MSKILVGIHGLKNKPPEDILEEWWRIALLEGLQGIGHQLQPLPFELVYWANILYAEPLDPKNKNEKHERYVGFPYVPSTKTPRPSMSPIRRKVLDYINGQLDKVFLNDDMSINFSSVSDLIIRRYFRDLNIYYSQNMSQQENPQSAAPEKIRNRLIQKLKEHRNNDILLIAHSMGSIIAYDVLMDESNDISVDTFVTIGSPLGLPVVRNKIISEQKKRFGTQFKITTPLSVKRHWFNFSDLRDKVAIDYKLSDDFAENVHHVQVIDFDIYNDYEYNGKINPHVVYGYLRAPELVTIIYNFLREDRVKPIKWMFEKVKKILSQIVNIGV